MSDFAKLTEFIVTGIINTFLARIWVENMNKRDDFQEFGKLYIFGSFLAFSLASNLNFGF